MGSIVRAKLFTASITTSILVGAALAAGALWEATAVSLGLGLAYLATFVAAIVCFVQSEAQRKSSHSVNRIEAVGLLMMFVAFLVGAALAAGALWEATAISLGLGLAYLASVVVMLTLGPHHNRGAVSEPDAGKPQPN